MRFGVCASYTDVQTLNDIPFDFLEENVQRFLIPEQPDDIFNSHLQAAHRLPIPIEAANSFLPASLPIIATPSHLVDEARLERYVKTTLQRAEQVGIRVIVFGSGAARRCPEGYSHDQAIEQVGERLAQWSLWCKEHGIIIALEPLRFEETNILNTVTESAQLLSRLSRSGATLLIDTYHMACNAESPESIVPWVSLLSHVHVAERQNRAAPGRYAENLRPYFSALRSGHYSHRISIECIWQDFPNEVAPAIATLREQWETHSTSLPTKETHYESC